MIDLYCVLVTSIIAKIFVIMIFPNSTPVAYQVPSTALTNIMACRVFRHTKLGLSPEAHNVNAMFSQSKHTVPAFARWIDDRISSHKRIPPVEYQ
jgi:hypothetical protein